MQYSCDDSDIFPIELKDDDSVIGRRSNKENLTLSSSIQSGEKSSQRRDKKSRKYQIEI